MPSLDIYKKLNNARTTGQAHKIQSDNVMEATWYNDISAKTAWFYDQDHDDEFFVRDNLHPEKSHSKIPVEVKIFEIEYNSLAKDTIALHLQFKPSYKCNIPYYKEKFADPLGAIFPIGMYVEAPDGNGIFHRYLVVDQYRYYSDQFPTYLILPCNHKLQWVYDNHKYESWCVLRSQNSYNSGIWQDYRITNPENQKIIWLPYNDKTQTIFYDQRIIISQNRKTPVVWSVSKVEDINVRGIARYTCAQDQFDPHKDYIEYDDNGNLIGMWASYYDNKIKPTELIEDTTNIYCKITYKGVQNNQFKVNGNARVFYVKFYKDDEEVNFTSGNWSFMIENQPKDDLFTVEQQDDDSFKIRFIGSDDYIGQKVTLKYTTNSNISSSIEMNIAGN